MNDWLRLGLDLLTILLGGGLVSVLLLRATRRKLERESEKIEAEAGQVSVQAADAANAVLRNTMAQLEHDQVRLRDELGMTRDELTQTRDELKRTQAALEQTRRELAETRELLAQLQKRENGNAQTILRLTQENAALKLRLDRVANGQPQGVIDKKPATPPFS